MQEQKAAGRKNPPTRPLSVIIKVKPQAKRAKIDEKSVEEPSDIVKIPDNTRKSPEPVKTSNSDIHDHDSHDVTKTVTGLVSYSDESSDDD